MGKTRAPASYETAGEWVKHKTSYGVNTTTLHLVFSELFLGQALEPLPKAPDVARFLAALGAAGPFDDRFLDHDRGLGAQGEGDGVGGAGIDGDGPLARVQVDGRVEGV